MSPDLLTIRRRGEWLLGEWATGHLRGDAKLSETLLRQAEEIGSLLEIGSGDRLLRRAVAVIRQAERKKPARLQFLARGHHDFHSVRGTALYSQCRPEVLARAEASLSAAASPFVGWVRLDQAVCAYFDKDFDRAESLLTGLQRNSATAGFLALQGRAAWILGLIRMVQARFVEADRHYATAIDIFRRLREDANVVYLRSLRAKNYEYGGAPAEAWRERLAALAGRQVVTDPERLYTIFEEAAQAMHRRGHSAAALGFLSEQMRAAETGFGQSGDADLLAFTLIARASLLTEIGRPVEAAADLARAQKAWEHLPPENESRRRLRVDLDVQRAALSRSDAAQTALAAVDRALAFFTGPTRSLGDQIEILRLHQLRAKIYLRLGNLAKARDDLRSGIAEVERQRLEVAGMEDRARFLAAARGLFLDLIQLELDHFHDRDAALEVLERSSNRVFADITQSLLGRDRALSSGRWAKVLETALPSDTLVIRYGHLSDRLLIWTFLNGRMDLEERSLPEMELRSRMKRCRELVAHAAAANERENACNGLAAILLPKRLRTLPAGRSVLIVADEIVASLPFAALRPSPRSPYLVELYRLSYSPSLSAWLTASAPGAPLPPPLSALFISDPAFSNGLFPLLSRLPGARNATNRYAAHYPKVEVLAERQATEAAVLSLLDRYEILQFDGHGMTNSQFPDQGGLLLAPADPSAPDSPPLC